VVRGLPSVLPAPALVVDGLPGMIIPRISRVCRGQGCVWSQTGIPAALAIWTAWVLPGLAPRMNAAQPSAPRAIISGLRRYPAARPYWFPVGGVLLGVVAGGPGGVGGGDHVGSAGTGGVHQQDALGVPVQDHGQGVLNDGHVVPGAGAGHQEPERLAHGWSPPSGRVPAQAWPAARLHRAGDGPYPGQARCLALGCWPECFRRLNVQGAEGHFRRKREAPLIVRGSTSRFRGHPRI
jgi:hypothetical protein